ncbi:MAG TPA: type II toxin-antitoxin system RelE/ParE family toxin [Verrucomicrobiae bacterium]|jgi:plasmid stabilization system protein ParE|nr:type II toxin-antitoxin system RelE/ParE family toxin [Verrucomicrobiae bacterium]
MRSVVVQPEANQEIDEAFGWYEDKEPGLGFRFLHNLETAYAGIARRPEIFQPVQSGFRRTLMQKFPYAVFFEFDEKLAVVHSVFHCSRNPLEWQSQLTPFKKIL